MATNDSTAPAEVGTTTDHIDNLLHESAYFYGRMNAFFDLVEREIKDQNSTDLDGIEFLVKGARVEFNRFTKLISKTECELEKRCNQNVISTDESRAGAMAGINALRAIERISGGNLSGISMEEWWAMQDECVTTTCNAAGNPGAFTAGFISAFVEYTLCTNSAGMPDLDKWKAEATMTEEEKKASRIRFEEAAAEGNKKIEVTEEDKERAYQEAASLANGWLGALPDSADVFKRFGVRHVERQIVFDCMARERGGYSFTKKTIREFDDAINLACNILRNGQVEYSEHDRDNEVLRLVGDAFNRGKSLNFTGHERNALVRRFMNELSAATDKAAAVPA